MSDTRSIKQSIAELEEECNRLKSQLVQQTIEFDIINDVVHEISQELDLKKILDLVALRAQELIHADSLFIPIINKEHTQYTYMAAVGHNAGTVLNHTFDTRMGMCGWVLSNQENLFFGEGSTELMGKQQQWQEGMESALLVPLKSRGKIVGGLSGLGKNGGESFTRQDLNVLQLFADHISIAIENAFIFNELKLEKEHVETTLKSIGDAVITTDANGMVTRMNPVAEKLTGWKEAEALQKPLADIFTIYNFDTQQPATSPVDKVMQTKEVVGLENHTVLQSRDQHEYQIADSAAPIFDIDNNIRGIILVFRDITEEYRLQEDLATNQKRLQSILDNTPAVIYIKDKDGRYQLINKQYEKLFNISVKKIIGMTDHDLFPKEMADVFRQNDLKVINNKQHIEIEEIAPQDDGPHSYISVKFPLLDAEGEVYATCGISTDITEHRKTEEALRRSQKMDAIGQLTGGIAHDFNNQLGIIIGYLEMLMDENINMDFRKECISYATGATQRCIDLTRQLLSFSRKQPQKTEHINVNNSITGMKTVIARSLTPSIDVKYELMKGQGIAAFDNGDFQDAILNLVINARDAMPSGGSLLIKSEKVELDKLSQQQQALDNGEGIKDYILVTVEDSGEGMDSETLEHIFEPFFTTKPVGKGTGLGLAMVYGFTKRHKGFVKVYSEAGMGTSIKLYLPVIDDDAHSHDSSEENKKLVGGNETLLVVDDEDQLLTLTSISLSKLGYNILTATNAAEALTILKEENNIDLLFSDIVMPGGINGYELAQKTREIKPDIKILLTSGFTAQNVKDPFEQDLANNLMRKPYRQYELASKLRELLDKK